jgi:hypothetical protein
VNAFSTTYTTAMSAKALRSLKKPKAAPRPLHGPNWVKNINARIAAPDPFKSAKIQ